MTRRFATKDAVSWLVQAFLGRPRLFDYAARRLADRRESVRRWACDGRSRTGVAALDPRFLVALLRP